jgi:uncharacterized protein YecT (DUF1311 family)
MCWSSYDDRMQSRYRVVVLAALVGLTAGCSSASSSSSSPSSSSSASASSGGTSSSAEPQVTPEVLPSSALIVEPFDPGHPARARTGPADCGSQSSTLAIEQCYEIKTENADAQINAAAQLLYRNAPAGLRTAIVAENASWLAAREPVCQAAFKTGGTIDGINVAACLLDESTAKLDAIKAIIPPEATLKSTDSTDPSNLSWYTTPEGSRIAEIDTQGDQTGGAVISWVIIGGAQGFVVNPKQFVFQDGSFTDPGIIQGTNPTNHTVATGMMYQFGIDYSFLSRDPNASKGTGGFVYVPGTPVAVWK